MLKSLLPRPLRKAAWLSLADRIAKPFAASLKLSVNRGFAVRPAEDLMAPSSMTKVRPAPETVRIWNIRRLAPT